MKPTGGLSVIQNRREAPDSLDLFPTPPWATRALFDHVLLPLKLVVPIREGMPSVMTAWEPACGFGHMSAVLGEYFALVIATDVFDYSDGDRARWPAGWFREQDFLDDRAETPVVDWIITNPPFKTAGEFALRGLTLACEGVALLVRTSWLEGGDRYNRIFRPHPPTVVAQFCERVPMVKGRWDPQASTATSYAWIVWTKGEPIGGTVFMWIPPGQRVALTKPDDVRRFTAASGVPLLEAAE